MKELRRKFNRWCFVNRNKGIPNLMLYICLGSGLVYLMSLMNGGSVLYSLLAFDKAKILQGQIWRLFTYVFTYQQGGNPILVIISLVCYYSLARAMEQVWGSLRFNLFYLSGILLMDIFAMICSPVSNGQMGTEAEMYSYLFSSFYSGRMAYYLNLTLLIGYATMYPDAQFLIFFVIPVRAWILGLLYLVLNVVIITFILRLFVDNWWLSILYSILAVFVTDSIKRLFKAFSFRVFSVIKKAYLLGSIFVHYTASCYRQHTDGIFHIPAFSHNFHRLICNILGKICGTVQFFLPLYGMKIRVFNCNLHYGTLYAFSSHPYGNTFTKMRNSADSTSFSLYRRP